MARYRILACVAAAALLSAGSVRIARTAPPEVHAIVEMSEHCLIGGVQNGKWIRADRFQKSLKKSGNFELFGLTGPAGELTLSRNADSECHESWAGKAVP